MKFAIEFESFRFALIHNYYISNKSRDFNPKFRPNLDSILQKAICQQTRTISAPFYV